MHPQQQTAQQDVPVTDAPQSGEVFCVDVQRGYSRFYGASLLRLLFLHVPAAPNPPLSFLCPLVILKGRLSGLPAKLCSFAVCFVLFFFFSIQSLLSATFQLYCVSYKNMHNGSQRLILARALLLPRNNFIGWKKKAEDGRQ